jgi:ribosomal protein S18
MEIDPTCGEFGVEKKRRKPVATLPTDSDYNTPAIQTRWLSEPSKILQRKHTSPNLHASVNIS